MTKPSPRQEIRHETHANKRGGNYSHTMRNGTDVYNFSYYDIDEVNKIITNLKEQRDELLATVREVQTEMNGIWSQQPYIAKWEKMLLEAIAKAGEVE